MMKTGIVIAGGGFAGVYAARHLDKTLARRSDIEVTLISRENFVVFTPMLHEVAAGDLSPNDIVDPLRRRPDVGGQPGGSKLGERPDQATRRIDTAPAPRARIFAADPARC